MDERREQFRCGDDLVGGVHRPRHPISQTVSELVDQCHGQLGPILLSKAVDSPLDQGRQVHGHDLSEFGAVDRICGGVAAGSDDLVNRTP